MMLLSQWKWVLWQKNTRINDKAEEIIPTCKKSDLKREAEMEHKSHEAQAVKLWHKLREIWWGFLGDLICVYFVGKTISGLFDDKF